MSVTRPITFKAQCRNDDCDHEITRPMPVAMENTSGIHVRCADCGVTNWAEKQL